jgi:hypothetical protein
MQAMNWSHINLFTQFNPTHFLLDNDDRDDQISVQDLLSPTALSCSATVRVTSLLKPSKNRTFAYNYPTWQFFEGEVRQYIDGPQIFTLTFCVDTDQPNLSKTSKGLTLGKWIDVTFVYRFPESNDEPGMDPSYSYLI